MVHKIFSSVALQTHSPLQLSRCSCFFATAAQAITHYYIYKLYADLFFSSFLLYFPAMA